MGVERIHHDAQLFSLPLHHVDGIMQERIADLRRGFAHKNARVRLAAHQDRQRPDVIKMRMRNQNGIELTIGDRLEVWKRFFAFQFRMHPAIEHEPLARRFEVIAISADLDATRKIDEFQKVSSSPSSS